MHFTLLMAAPSFIHKAALALLLTVAAAVSAFAAAPVAVPGSSLSSPYRPGAPPAVPQSPPPEREETGVAEASGLASALAGSGTGPASAGETDGARDEEDWSWRRAGVAEYVAVPLAIAGTLVFEKEHGEPPRPKWRARNGFDEGVRDVLRLKSRSSRDAAHTVGDVLMSVMIAAPVVDTFATLGFRDGRWDALLQSSMVNLESFAFTSLVSSLMQNLIAREKPFVRNCVNGGDCDADSEFYRSMPSGHVAFALTGAGLLCTHQQYLSLHDPATQRAACATGIGLAALDGVARIMADRHYATDVLAGTAIGLFSGFVLPRLLHYSRPVTSPEGEARRAGDSPIKGMTINPRLLSGGAALYCDFRF